MANSERTEGPTPNGGAYSILYFQDADGNPVEKSEATRAEAVEFDAPGNQIFRTYLELEVDTVGDTRSLLDR